MEDIDNYKGYLIAAHPKRNDSILRKGVILVIDQDNSGSVGLQINKPMENNTNLATIMQGLGLSYNEDTPVYFGGVENTNRIIVVHTSDWMSSGSTAITRDLAISNDMSVLVAIASGKGPSSFRAIAGYTRWLPGHLENQIDCDPPYNDISLGWNLIKANADLIFLTNGSDQWHHVINESVKIQVENLF